MLRNLGNVNPSIGERLSLDLGVDKLLSDISREIETLEKKGVEVKTKGDLLKDQMKSFFTQLGKIRDKLSQKNNNSKLVDRVVEIHIKAMQTAEVLPQPFDIDTPVNTLAEDTRFRTFILLEEKKLIERTGRGLEQYVDGMRDDYASDEARILDFITQLEQQNTDYVAELIDGFNVSTLDGLDRYRAWVKYLASPDSDYLQPMELRFLLAISIAQLRYHENGKGYLVVENDTIDLVLSSPD